jgi:hypothetical protein
LATLYDDDTYHRFTIGEGCIQRQPSELAPSKAAYFNIEDIVSGTLDDVETHVTVMPQITGDVVYSGSDLFNIVVIVIS